MGHLVIPLIAWFSAVIIGGQVHAAAGEEALPGAAPTVESVRPGAARRGSPFKTRIDWDKQLATITWTEPLGAGKEFLLLTGPFIGWLSEREATIGWEVIAETRLTESPYASLPGSYDMERMKFRWAKLEGLKADTVYRYRLVSDGGAHQGQEHTFRTLPAVGADKFRFAVIGDTQRALGSHAAENKALYGLLEAEKVPLILHLGDVVYGGSGYSFPGRKSWFRTLKLMDGFRASAFMAPSPGNHDLSVGRYPWPPDYFGDIPVGRNAAGASRPPYYYSFVAANVHFIALSTEVRKTDRDGTDLSDVKVYDAFTYNEQLAWLDAELVAVKSEWTVVYTHQPLHTVGGYAADAALRRDLGAILDRHKVPLLLSGHDHSYQRTWRIDNADRRKSDSGTVQVISGGASNFFDGRTADWNICHQKINHYLRVEVDGAAITVEAVTVGGKVFDRWKPPKSGQPEELAVSQDGGQTP